MAGRLSRLAAACLFVLAAPVAARAQQLVILSTDGETRDGLTVVTPHPAPQPIASLLTRGYSGRLVRLYAMEQEFLRQRTGTVPEPAYLVLSNQQGGFPRFGFVRDGVAKPGVGWVDLHRSSTLSGRFGALDQIFPHELMHVIVRQLAGAPRPGGSHQVHAIGVRTDAVTAFQEGLAEAIQILAIDDPDAASATAALRENSATRDRAERQLDAYARDLARRWSPIQSSRLRFLLWFGQVEQVLRYHAVKANRFAYEPEMPASLVAHPYDAYLFRSVVPGQSGVAPKSAAAVLATDGGVAHLCWRLLTDAALQQRLGDDAMYATFGASAAAVTPLENVHLKLFTVLADWRPSTLVDLLDAWRVRFPDDAGDIDRLVAGAIPGGRLPHAAELWLENDALMTGTSLYDQYRAQPRTHTFDANAASVWDWLSVTGISRDAALTLVRDIPYRDLDTLLASPGLNSQAKARIAAMDAAARRRAGTAADAESSVNVARIAASYLWRFALLVAVCVSASATLVRATGVKRRWAAMAVALAATLLVIAFAWIITSPASYRLLAPLAIGGLPWAAWRLMRRRGLRGAGVALAVWLVAAVPALIVTAL
jgi:hypothetical protein